MNTRYVTGGDARGRDKVESSPHHAGMIGGEIRAEQNVR
jgi:hypothetical protein